MACLHTCCCSCPQALVAHTTAATLLDALAPLSWTVWPCSLSRLFCSTVLRLSSASLCCSVYSRAFSSLRESQPDAKEEAVMLLEAWRAFEAESNSSSPEQQQVGQSLFACCSTNCSLQGRDLHRLSRRCTMPNALSALDSVILILTDLQWWPCCRPL